MPTTLQPAHLPQAYATLPNRTPHSRHRFHDGSARPESPGRGFPPWSTQALPCGPNTSSPRVDKPRRWLCALGRRKESVRRAPPRSPTHLPGRTARPLLVDESRSSPFRPPVTHQYYGTVWTDSASTLNTRSNCSSRMQYGGISTIVLPIGRVRTPRCRISVHTLMPILSVNGNGSFAATS